MNELEPLFSEVDRFRVGFEGWNPLDPGSVIVRGGVWTRVEPGVSLLTADHQRRVEHDAREPSRKCGAALERAKVTIRGEKGILNGVLRVFLIPQDRVGLADESRTSGQKHVVNCFPILISRFRLDVPA